MAEPKPPGGMNIVVLAVVLTSGGRVMLAQNMSRSIEVSPDQTMPVVCISMLGDAICGFFIGGVKAERSR